MLHVPEAVRNETPKMTNILCRLREALDGSLLTFKSNWNPMQSQA
jgi:hypothetical protein